MKLIFFTDSYGIVLALDPIAGQAHESKHLEALLDASGVPHQGPGRWRKRPETLVGDKGFSYPGVRKLLLSRGIRPLIPLRSEQMRHHKGRQPFFDSAMYTSRHIVENCVGWLNECRRIGTRFKKLAVHFLAMIQMACIRRYFRHLGLADST